MSDLTAFLTARLDEDEAAAKAAAGPDWFLDSAEDDDKRDIRCPSTLYPGRLAVADGVHSEDAEHIARHDPTRVLREVAAKRAILGQYEDVAEWDPPQMVGALEDAVRALAAVYSDHPDYDQAWAS